ncbi:putative beta-lysine N-acetyltransferase [Desulfonatronum sp. SC1]|uniref:putative beta-lysine N-acetyltransferase n=1 Tax=Desulfonatronum sp. SC1 TaxID=2109626 RepID=UPI000D324320|nr:putative beta-lysine N-acetyltransferase [Desulfonatronum sp. SC1]PTN34446.1 putative beta-lysine N-acetyltransferase [Desulfonatronum sp. SC1]
MSPNVAPCSPSKPSVDKLERIGASLIQHGPLNARAYLMHLAPPEEPTIVPTLEKLARTHGYTKIFAKVPEGAAARFTRAGYAAEAVVPGLYNGREAGVFMGRYFADWRRHPANPHALRDVLAVARKKAAQAAIPSPSPSLSPSLPQDSRIIPLGPDQAEDMAEVYRAVFDSYPFPIFDPGYLRSSMTGNTRFYGVLIRDRLAALASAEMDPETGSAEMTDFATLPEFRGRKLAGILLAHMTERMRDLGLSTLYTIARAESYAMNVTFARAGYVFGGTLPNNTHIGGGLESMNVWHLALRDAPSQPFNQNPKT